MKWQKAGLNKINYKYNLSLKKEHHATDKPIVPEFRIVYIYLHHW